MKKENDPNRLAAIVSLCLILGFMYVTIYCMVKELFDALTH